MGENYAEPIKQEIQRAIDELPPKGKINIWDFARKYVFFS